MVDHHGLAIDGSNWRTFMVGGDGTVTVIRKFRRKRWTRERRAMLCALAVCGWPHDYIAMRLDISEHAVSCELSRLGLTRKALSTAPTY